MSADESVLGQTGSGEDRIVELSCNLDDMTGEDMGFATEQLLSAGAVDVFTTPIYMKKNRPAWMLTVLCREEQREEMVQLLFRHTTTLGIRQTLHRRFLQRRAFVRAETPWGPVGVKCSGTGCKPEYEDLKAIAQRENLPIAQVRQAALESFKETQK